MATDIAFALGVMALLGPRLPLGLKVFLTALAIVDDIGAVLVIALFYTGEISWFYLAVAAGILVILLAGNWLGIDNPLYYSLLGIGLWLAFLESGIHATLAGVRSCASPSLPR
jgi:NhaA family Na+:H+ antiporter